MKGVEIYIDDELLEIDQTTSAAISHEIASIEEPDKSLTGNAKDIEVPYTARNRKIMQFSEQILSRVLFNNSGHSARIFVNGSLVMYGAAYIDKYMDSGNNFGHYALKILGASADWVKRANTLLVKELADNFSVKYFLRDVYENSILTKPTLIKFFPVDRGTYYQQNASGDMEDRTSIDITDYHPFINIWMLLALIFEGYTISSSMESFFRRLYMSGFVPEPEDSEGIEEDNNFKVASTLNTDAVAATFFAQSRNTYQVNLFNRWWSSDNELFVATNGIMQTVGGYTVFIPTLSCTVSFRMTVSYNSTVGKNNEYVDTLKFGAGENVQKLHVTPYMSNEYDAGFGGYVPRESASGGYAKCRYMWFLKLKRPSDWTKIIKREYAYKQGLIVSVGKTRDTVLTENIKPEGQWLRVYVGEGMVSVKTVDYYVVDANGNEKMILPGVFEKSDIVPIPDGTLSFSDIEFNTYSFGIGAGQSFPLRFEFAISTGVTSDSTVELRINGTDYYDGSTSYGCTITPDFRNAFAYGSNIGISVIGGDKTQLQIIQALRHLFNLYFYTNPITKEVFIEPRTSFYRPISKTNTYHVDWTDRIDYTHEVENEQLGNNIGNALRLAYAEGNDVIKKFNRRNRCKLGTFQTALDNKTTTGTKELTNTLFSPFIRRKIERMGWTVLQNVQESEQSTVSDVEFDITTTIGIFSGVASRTTGTDRGIYPSYPVLVFQELNHNLGFEDSVNGTSVVKGLHQYYDANIQQYNRARRITAYLRLSALDMEKIQCPSEAFSDFRSVFTLKHKGEILYLELEKIADYNPSSGESTKCTFVTKVVD